MNRKLLALAVGAALSLPLAVQAAPTVYGQLNLSVDMVDLESVDGDALTPGIQSTDNWQVNSNSSRLGIMGEEALGNGLSAVYKAEWAVAGDQAGGNDLTGRDRYLGLKGSFGTVKLGAYDSPFKSSQGMVDQFNDMTFTDMGTFITGENRMNNLIGYESPKIADAINVKVAIQPGESNNNDGPAEAISAAVAYEAGGLYVALGLDMDAADGNFSEPDARDAVRLSASYTMDNLQLGALLQTSEASNNTAASTAAGNNFDEQALLLSAGFAMGKIGIRGQFIMANDDFEGADEQETMALEVGYDYNFTKMTRAFAEVAFATTDNLGGVSGQDADDTVLTVGMQTKF